MTYNGAIEDVSVVIPTFNRRNLLKRAINSVIKQTIEPREIIVIDNGSTDQTYQMVSSLPLSSRRNQDAQNHGINPLLGKDGGWNQAICKEM